MSVQETNLKAIADAIRAKDGTADAIQASAFAERIAAIQTGVDTSDTTAAAGDILSGKTAYSNGQKITETIASTGPATLTPGKYDWCIQKGKYVAGDIKIPGDSNLEDCNIRSGVMIFGVSGTYLGEDALTKVSSTSSTQLNGDSNGYLSVYESNYSADTKTLTLVVGTMDCSSYAQRVYRIEVKLAGDA